MAIPNFLQQSQSSLRSGLDIGGALQNAETLLLNRGEQQQIQGIRAQNQEFNIQQQPLQLRQMEAQATAAEQDNERKDLLQTSILLSSLSEKDGKKLIPEMINKYQGNEPVLAGLRDLYQSKGVDYISKTFMAVSAFSGKAIGGAKKRALSEPEKNLETMTRLQGELNEATQSGDADLIEGRQKQLDTFTRLTDKFKATAQEKQDIKIKGITTKSNIQRRQGYIDSGVDAADGYFNLKRSIKLLKTIPTGGFDAAALKAKQMFGIESANEAELSARMGKSVMAQLKPLFGAAFTEGEGNRLVAIEAGFGKSTVGNIRLINETMRIAERAMRRGLKAAEDQGDQFVVDEIKSIMDSFKESKPVNWADL